jgi:CHAD domain-containing protein
VALRLAAAADAAGRMPEDRDALHDLRVALRRMRSDFRAWGPELGGIASKKIRKSVKRLAAATSAGRDAEVQGPWLLDHLAALPLRQRPAARRLARQMTQLRAATGAYWKRDGKRAFAELRQRLEKRLAAPAPALTPADPCFGTRLAELLEKYARALERAARQAARPGESAALHAARIAGKRLRYLLESAAPAIPPARDAVAGLQRLQDRLGELHDRQTVMLGLRREIEAAALRGARAEADRAGRDAPAGRVRRAARPPGMAAALALIGIARAEIAAGHAQFRAEWGKGLTDALRGSLAATALRLHELSPKPQVTKTPASRPAPVVVV